MPDREKVIKDLEECLSASCRGFRPRVSCPYNDDEWDIMRDAIELLKEQKQKIDVLEDQNARLIRQKEAGFQLVRCKDCKHNWWVNPDNEKVVCRYCYGEHEPDWYCADGERKDDTH